MADDERRWAGRTGVNAVLGTRGLSVTYESCQINMDKCCQTGVELVHRSAVCGSWG